MERDLWSLVGAFLRIVRLVPSTEQANLRILLPLLAWLFFDNCRAEKTSLVESGIDDPVTVN